MLHVSSPAGLFFWGGGRGAVAKSFLVPQIDEDRKKC